MFFLNFNKGHFLYFNKSQMDVIQILEPKNKTFIKHVIASTLDYEIQILYIRGRNQP